MWEYSDEEQRCFVFNRNVMYSLSQSSIILHFCDRYQAERPYFPIMSVVYILMASLSTENPHHFMMQLLVVVISTDSFLQQSTTYGQRQ